MESATRRTDRPRRLRPGTTRLLSLAVRLTLMGSAALAVAPSIPASASPPVCQIANAAFYVPAEQPDAAPSAPPAPAATPAATSPSTSPSPPPPSPSAAAVPAGNQPVGTSAAPKAPAPAPVHAAPPPPPAPLTLVAAGTYTDCSGSTPLPSTRIYIDACYHGGTMLMAHDYGAGAVFYQLWPGSALVFAGRTYHVDSRRVMSVAGLFDIFNWNAPLVLLTCDGAGRLVLTAH